MKLYLSKICSTGPAPCMTVRNKISNIVSLKLCKDDGKLASYILTDLYINRKFSQQKIAELFNVQHDTIRRWLDRLDIPVRSQGDSVSLAMTKHLKTPFNGDVMEKAYLLGIRAGDVSAQVHGRIVRIQSGSTHPAFLELFESIFGVYGSVSRYTQLNRNKKLYDWSYHWNIYCDVDKSFDFMLNKPERIPDWVKEDDRLFFLFLSGYFDAEGCLSVSYTDRGRSIIWKINSSDIGILSDIKACLIKNGFRAKLTKSKEADGIKYNNDYWSITVCNRNQVLELLKIMNIRHPEKVSKYRLASELVNTDWKDAENRISEFRNDIKKEVKRCVESAKEEYERIHSETPR